MMKNKNIIASMFDDTEPYMPSQQQEEGIANKQGTSAETEKSDTYSYLQKLLELERKIATTQQRQIEIQAEQKRLSAQLQDSCKDFKVSLSEEDKKLIEEMPADMAKEFGRYKTGIAEYVNNIINRHKESTIKNIDATCEAKIEKTRKEMGVGKGIYLSWPNFWAMFLTTIVCISYTTYTAFNQCLVGVDMGENMASPPRFCRHVWMRSLDCLAEHQGGQATQTLNVPVKGDFESQEPFRFTSESSRRL